MTEFFGIGFAITTLLFGILLYLLEQSKQDYAMLKKVNDNLLRDNGFLSNKNFELWKEVENLTRLSIDEKIKLQEIINKADIREYPVDAKVSWIDSNGDTEYGIIVDDSKIDGKTFVHIRRLNKRGRFVGGVITISANRIKLEN